MKKHELSLKNLCELREDLFNKSIEEQDALDISHLRTIGRINVKDFFEKNYITEGMQELTEKVFRRFKGDVSSNGVIKLTQGMGGGKTHNMITIGLLAQHPEFRKRFFGPNYNDNSLYKVDIAVFSGRNTDTKLYLWGEIADQIGKLDNVKDLVNFREAPGQDTWVNLLKGRPLLILVDELPYYLNACKSKQVGDSTLSAVTATALTNLFVALQTPELSNVCLVLSDLTADYEDGSELIRQSFRELERECGRVSFNITPVDTTNDDIYKILSKKLFKSVAKETDIKRVAEEYKKKLEIANKSGSTSISPDEMYNKILHTYPFHPCLKELYSRFENNQNCQKTRGLVRLMKHVVSDIYNNSIAEESMLVNFYDMDFSNINVKNEILNINSALKKAIEHDILDCDKEVFKHFKENEKNIRKISSLILLSSLANIPDAQVGIDLNYIAGNLVDPCNSISGPRVLIEQYAEKAFYLHFDGSTYLFKKEENIQSIKFSYMNSRTNEMALSDIKNLFSKKINEKKPNKFIQHIYFFEELKNIKTDKSKLSVVFCNPNEFNQKEINNFFDNAEFKRKVLVIGNQDVRISNLYDAGKEYYAWDRIVNEFTARNDSKNIDNLDFAKESLSNSIGRILDILGEMFNCIYFYHQTRVRALPLKLHQVLQNEDKDLESTIIESLGNQYVNLLDVARENEFKDLIQDRLFIANSPTSWRQIEDNAARDTTFPFHEASALDYFKTLMFQKKLWREKDGKVEIGPFKEKPILRLEVSFDNAGNQVFVFDTHNCDKPRIYYSLNNDEIDFSGELYCQGNELLSFGNNNPVINFICVDIDEDGKIKDIGDKYYYRAKFEPEYDATIDEEGRHLISLKTKFDIPIYYSLDGSNSSMQKYEKEIEIDLDKVDIVTVICKNEFITSDQIVIRVKDIWVDEDDDDILKHVNISRRTKIKKYLSINSTADAFNFIKKIKDVNGKCVNPTIKLACENNVSISVNFTGKTVEGDTFDKLGKLIIELQNDYDKNSNVIVAFDEMEFEKGKDFIEIYNDSKNIFKELKRGDIRQ